MEIAEQVVADIAGAIGAAVAVVDADEGAEAAGLDLALVLEDLVGLDDDHGGIAGSELSDVVEPEEAILAFSSDGGGGITGVITVLEQLPTACDKAHECMEHPTCLRNPNPRLPNTGNLFFPMVARI